MDIRPQDLPELRAELVAYYRTARGKDRWCDRRFASVLEVAEPDGRTSAFNPSPTDRLAAETERVEAAELFFVGRDMVDLAKAAGDPLPAFAIDQQDLPAPGGFIVFETPIYNSGGPLKWHGNVSAASWSVQTDEKVGALLWISFYFDNHKASPPSGTARRTDPMSLPRYGHIAEYAWPFDGDVAASHGTGLYSWGRTLVAAWLLMQQPLAEIAEVELDRAARKRLRREGHEPAIVRVIELRRPKHSGSDPAESGRNYVHRWITRGHWRQQWYATRQVHRPVWIAPHVKGPEGAPMIGGEKVYAWKR